MQELISKNPILRYKLGKLIVKAAGGATTPTVVGIARRHDYKKGEVEYSVYRGKPIARYKSGPDTRWYYIAEGSTGYDRYGNKNTFLGGRWLSDIIGEDTIGNPVRVDRNTGDLYQLHRGKHVNIGKTLKYYNLNPFDNQDNGQFNGENYIYSDLKKPSTVAKETPTKVSTSTKGSDTSSGKATTAGKSNVVVGNTKVVTPINDNHYIAAIGDVNRYKNVASQLGLADRDAVRRFQTEKLGLTGSAADGIWGRNTLKAYDNYINNTSSEAVNLVNNAVKGYANGIKKVNNVSTTNAAQIMPTVTNFANPSVNIPDIIKVGSSNAANTKAFTDRLYNSIKITPTFKNGGLVSNNPIKRFKIKFLNGGPLISLK